MRISLQCILNRYTPIIPPSSIILRLEPFDILTIFATTIGTAINSGGKAVTVEFEAVGPFAVALFQSKELITDPANGTWWERDDCGGEEGESWIVVVEVWLLVILGVGGLERIGEGCLVWILLLLCHFLGASLPGSCHGKCVEFYDPCSSYGDEK